MINALENIAIAKVWHVAQRSNTVNEDTTDLGELRAGKKRKRPDSLKKNARADAATGKIPGPQAQTINTGNGAALRKSANASAGERPIATNVNRKHRLSGDVVMVTKDAALASPPDRSGPAVNDVIADRYLVVDSLPGSGMGQIYKALDRRRTSSNISSTYVALKFARSSGNENLPLSRIQNEFRKLSLLEHRNIVRAVDSGVYQSAEYLVLEWLDGKSLFAVLDEQTSKRLALVRAREAIESVSAGLAHAHERNIVHGDVKPSNIFISDKHGIKLLDFGTSTDSGDVPRPQDWATEIYASAEILSGSPATKPDDVFSLGVTAYLLLSGNRPFGSKNALTARQEGLAPKPLPADAEDYWPVVKAALSFEPQDRPRDAAQFLAGFHGATWEKSPEVRQEHRPAAQTGLYPFAAALVFLLLVWGGWSTRPEGPQAPNVDELLRRADTALLQGSLIEPAQRSAFHYYRQALQYLPDNPRALDGMDEVTNGLLSRAGQSLSADDFRAARRNLLLAAQVNPSHSGIPLVAELIKRHSRDLIVRADRIALSDPRGADLLLRDAEQLSGRNNADIATVREKMADAMVELELQSLFDGIDARILAERLAVPRGDSAVALLRKARNLRPEDRRIPVAANRIVSALLFQALFAISEENLEAAESYIEAARSLDTRHLAMARAEYELVKARNRMGAGDTVAETGESVIE